MRGGLVSDRRRRGRGELGQQGYTKASKSSAAPRRRRFARRPRCSGGPCGEVSARLLVSFPAAAGAGDLGPGRRERGRGRPRSRAMKMPS